ncbi:alpha-2-macroglobulin isoform X2 [Pleuronectes platessa]|uniref:alpha-2-macroglobulin isoform X2 n=1 Tax=Pleuronectes platessa TaxID=8262 RepID=UPI00232A4595|nr:alpha-2-macroglobulin isoform X2 [Pleuronectes platessa]
MGRPWIQMWTWTLCVLLSCMCVAQVMAGPHYMVAIPAVLEAGAETKFCASLLKPNETLDMTITLISAEMNTTLLKKSSSQEFHDCVDFKVPLVQNQEVYNFEVELKGKTFYSKEVRKVKATVYQPMTFVQTDKPIYLPGQTMHFRVVTLDSRMRPTNRLYNIIEVETGKKGCATFNFKMTTFTKLDQKVLQDYLDLIVEVEEEGTGISLQQMKRLQISYVIGKLMFIDTPKIYDKGSNVEGKVKAVHFNDTPIADKKVYLIKGVRWSSCLLQNLTSDSDGVATFSFSTAELNGEINLHVSNKPTLGYSGYRTRYYETGQHTVSMSQPPSADTQTVSSLEVVKKTNPLSCDTKEEISIKYTVVGEKGASVMVMYLVLSRGAIIMQGFKHIEVQDLPVTEGGISFELNVHPNIAPEVQVLAYAVLPSETVIANSADFSVEKCFSHKVSLEFLPSSAVPGEETTMQLKAQPDSLCGVSAVDQSVLIMRPGEGLTADKIFNLLPVTKRSYVPYDVHDAVECLRVRPRRYIHPHPSERTDAFKVFERVGLKMATNLFIQMPPCLNFRGREYHQYHQQRVSYQATPLNRMASAPGSLLPAIETVRTFFPETWIWDLMEVGASGTKDVSLLVPDTITTWETEAFCLSPQGFGLAPRKEITVFQPFFLELTMPYSIIRGEHFELKATIFNYLSSCIMVSVTPAHSLDYTLTPLSGDKYTSCLCGNERLTLSWNMSPTALGVVNVSVTAEAVASHTSCDNEIVSVPARGRIDMVTRPLIVKAEGTEMTKTHNLLLCPKGEALTEEVELQLPENVIDGSARASLSVLGDILGRALKNLDGLLRMPYGCGEQNMALLAPNIYILQYLKNTQQLTPAIMEKSTNFLSSGYQRQLNYKHIDGAYSTFGSGTGNTWLTAFVLRSFAKAKSFIYIDPRNIESSKTWLEEKQRKNGCFEQSGKLFNNRMKGGVSDEVTLTAYITAGFLEMNSSTDDAVVKKSLSCLKESANDLSNTYTTALLAYVFTLAGDMETRAHLLTHLDRVGHKQGGFLHWSQTATETSASLSVEISSYVMLAKLSASPIAEDLGYTSRIVRWLTGQQNYYGGFSSTQDTVVALQALALYSTLVFSPDGSSTVMVQSPSGQLSFDVNRDNKLLYQEKTLQDVIGKYSVKVKGSACASIQISLNYNIPTPTEVTSFSVEVKPEADCAKNKLSLLLKCLYHGKENNTNMVILDIKMLSGFVPDPQSLKELKGALLVDRVEEKEDHVMVYIRELPKDIPINYRLRLIQELPVQNLKPAVVKMYDYYQPSDQAETEYIYTCAAGNNTW